MNKDNIITNLDIWSTSQTLKTSNRGRGASNQSLYGINKLRELILELAVRGKLVVQNPEDEPASVLLKKIDAEKKRLIKEGKIKKQDKLLEITEDENLFDLPKTWEWRHLEECFRIMSGTSFDKTKELEIGQFLYVKVADMNIEGNEVEITTSSRFYNPIEKELNALIPEGSIIFPKRGGAIATNKKRLTINDLFVDLNIMAITPINGISLNFAYLWLLGIDLAKLNTGTSVPQINHKDIAPLLFPIPPLPEQHRIVAKVDELMALCDRLEQQQSDSNSAHEILVETLLDTLTNATDQKDFESSWRRIANHFDTLFTTERSIDRLKQTILQLAVMGKLVPQNPEDEPASELLKKIGKEKARLVKEGVNKESNSLNNINEDENPFDIPATWEWEKMEKICTLITDGTHLTPSYTTSGRIFISAQNIKPFQFIPEKHRWVSEEDYQGYIKNRKPELNDILLTRVGAGIGEAAVIDTVLEFAIYVSVGLLKPSKGNIDPNYLVIWLNSPLGRNHSERNTYGKGVSQGNLNLSLIRNFSISIPPLAEQHRIVYKVDELFAICDGLKGRIHDAQVTQLNLATALVEGAMGGGNERMKELRNEKIKNEGIKE